METDAKVCEIDGKLVLIDPTAEGMITAVRHHNYGIMKNNCRLTYEAQKDRVQHFVTRIQQLRLDPKDVVIVLINVDDVHGKDLAEALMPGHNWDEMRKLGQIPFARGLAEKSGIEDVLEVIDPRISYHLKNIKGIAVVVVDHGTADVYEVQ